MHSLMRIAISVPDEVLSEVDRAARGRGESRSRYITRVLRAAMRARRDAEITRRLDELCASDELSASDELCADQMREAARLDDVGTAWDHERW